ncbi:penicillin acylase family protein [Microbacterium sp. kSW2-24]|uniref:penicillin acylase family protein n=1 Tax=Microbacterium galbinum TaxID=2851646 RepID=UPI001FFCB5ED|nr:penicillin acylase family protein [Microbacterium galbinum]MCK2023338.1 penicillin acylase family protein [Microbacterium galbinum]
MSSENEPGPTAPPEDGIPFDVFVVEGLDSDVEIVIDLWGVPHITAGSRADAFVAQGFNAARDRLFQIDLWRRRGLGRLSAAFGPEHLAQDHANRLFLYRGDIEAEWESYAAGTREAVRSFVAGINAYVRWASAAPGRLPPEFVQQGYAPELWGDDDIVRFRTHGLFYNATHEVARARALRSGGPDVERVRQTREPDTPVSVPDGLDLALLDDVMQTYDRAFAPVSFSESAVTPQHEGGSNNWVVDGSRTTTGRPVLANDPHRAVTLPSLRYLAHLRAPGLDVIGAGEPGLPGIAIGHNDSVAFGLTIWPADVEDLYVYDLDPARPGQYRGPEGWVDFDEIVDTIEVRDGEAVEARLLRTVHGPIIHVDDERGFAVALRAAWLEPGMVPYLASVGYGDAVDAESFLAALANWGAPAVNQIYATVEGDWGWQASGRIPRRRGWDGSLPVPGDGAYEWEGFATTGELPSERASPRGWFASANEANIPEGFDDTLTITHDWYSSARADRIKAWLALDDAVSIESSAAMQQDDLSEHALAIVELLEEAIPSETDMTGEWNALCRWNGRTSADSRGALVFEIWARRHLRGRLATEYFASTGIPGSSMDAAVAAATRDESAGGDLRGDIELVTWATRTSSPERIAAVVNETLAAAITEITSLLGPEVGGAAWCWGRLLRAELRHPLLAGRARGVVGPLPRGGSGDTVGLAAYDADFRQTTGSTFRMVIDVGDWDASVAMNSPGQSGDPRSPHYDDLFADWVGGRTFPLVYSEDAIGRHAAHRILLRAGQRPRSADPAECGP